MKRMGNLVGAAPPQSDWSQTNPTCGDYIRNKPLLENYLTVEAGATKTYVDSRRFTASAVIPCDWTEGECQVMLAGLSAEDLPHVSPVYGEDYPAQREAWGCISEGEAAEGKIIFRCFEETPNIAIPIQVEVIR